MKFTKWLVSLIYDSCFLAIGCKREMRSVGPLLQETTGLPTGLLFLRILVIELNLVFAVGFGLMKATCRSYCQYVHYIEQSIDYISNFYRCQGYYKCFKRFIEILFVRA